VDTRADFAKVLRLRVVYWFERSDKSG
jgi:hypothetical protein